MRNAYADLVGSIDVGKEMKRASQIQFSGEAAPELLHLAGRAERAPAAERGAAAGGGRSGNGAETGAAGAR